MPSRGGQRRPNKRPIGQVDLSGSDMKAKRSRMTEQMKYCHSLLNQLYAKKHTPYAWPFYEPVDTRRFKCPDYYEVIKHPMDLGTIRKKMGNHQYRSPEEFASDMRLMFENCYKYNPPGHGINLMAKELQRVFEAKFAEMPYEPLTNGLGTDSCLETSARSTQKKRGGGVFTDSSSDSDVSEDSEEDIKKFKTMQNYLRVVNEYVDALITESVRRCRKKRSKKKKEEHGERTEEINNQSQAGTVSRNRRLPLSPLSLSESSSSPPSSPSAAVATSSPASSRVITATAPSHLAAGAATMASSGSPPPTAAVSLAAELSLSSSSSSSSSSSYSSSSSSSSSYSSSSSSPSSSPKALSSPSSLSAPTAVVRPIYIRKTLNTYKMLPKKLSWNSCPSRQPETGNKRDESRSSGERPQLAPVVSEPPTNN